MFYRKFPFKTSKFCRTKFRFEQPRSYKMSYNAILVQKFNPGTGSLEWDLQAESYDYTQEIARSGFADMLHDEERNLKYNLALNKALNILRIKGKVPRVLDIGTGTGLLAMMAVKANASAVFACETFQPMVKCSTEVIAHNGFADSIKIIPKRSTEITVGPQKDMEDKANVLITEVFDTELIGEGAIGTFNHANQQLLSEDSVVIPARATIYVQLIESHLVTSWNRSMPINLGGDFIYPPSKVSCCPGNGAVHDIQLAQLKEAHFKALSDPIPIFNFDWNSKVPIPVEDTNTVNFVAKCSGKAHAILMWWTLDMDMAGEIVLSCAPPWAHPEGNELPWRDHWMQAIYYFPNDITIKSEGERLHLTGYHDEYSLWFGLQTETPPSVTLPRPFCDCSVHLACSRPRLGQLNDNDRNQKYIRVLEKVISSDTVCLTLGDCCLLGLIVAKLGARKVYAAERNPHCRRVLEAWVKRNDLEEQVTILDGDLEKRKLDLKVNLVLGEPVFESSVLPWHNLYFARWKNNVQHLLADGVTKILPGKAYLYAMAVEMKDLWKIRAPVRSTQGIDLSVFDNLIESAIDTSDSQVEPHPLWEYPTRALSPAIQLMMLDLTTLSLMTKEIPEVEGKVNLPVTGTVNGVALWIDWQLDEATVISGGPTAPVTLGQNVQWDMHSKQAVYFIKDPVSLQTEDRSLSYQINFVPDTYEYKFKFSIL
ncbi:Protein arginine N-methyltransferase 7 [Daphnia magna]|uniref:Protein arginine N-methyltransferase n=1 Tax=Daphnia magna TaxID=35525 RepID=A0A0P5EFH1_9CRUS|nr:Protein arginine N-methyltransferase 7 [Daphnia magna]